MSFNNGRDIVFGDLGLLIAGSTTINPGDMVATASGYASSASATTGLKIWGIAVKGDGNARGNLNSSNQIDNSAGSNGAFNVVTQTSWPKSGGRRAFPIGNDGSNPCSQATVGSVVYATSATTVGTSSSGLSRAGTCVRFDSVNNLVYVVFDQ